MFKSLKRQAVEELRTRAAGRAINPVQFLKHFWQKKPLLVPGAFPAFRDPVTRDELAGLACEEDVESRLVMGRGGTHPWQVFPGPQHTTRLKRLPRSHWTLLVQGVDRFIPGVAALLEPFRFIPDWRVDDVMISFAPRGGTVGPHIDSYDVFLLQGQGRRRWRIDSQAPKALRPGLDLRVLKQFHAEEDWILEPGDMLYLPPDLAHYGVALEECLTYSIGFRSPSAMTLLASAQERLVRADTPDRHYQDPGLKMPSHPGEIPRAAIRDLRRLLEGALNRLGDADFDLLIGGLLTEPKASASAEQRPVSAAAVRSRLKQGADLVRSTGSRLGFLRQGRHVVLFADGRRYSLSPSTAFAAPLLTEKRRFSSENLSPYLNKQGFVPLLASLISAGTFRMER